MRRALVALLTAIAALAAAAPASAAIPASVKWKSSAPLAAWNNGGFIVYNNEWNHSAGPQTIWADSYQHWGVESTQPAANTAIETYPCVQKIFNNPRVSSFRLIRNGFTESMPANTKGLHAEAADDVWLNNYNVEMMIWTDKVGRSLAGTTRIGNATIFGQQFSVWRLNSEFIFVLDHNETSGMTHIQASLKWLIRHSYLKANATLTQVDFGWEIASTNGKPEDFKITKYWLHTRRS